MKFPGKEKTEKKILSQPTQTQEGSSDQKKESSEVREPGKKIA
jgi:hypothetical protein